nr:MAG TPA: hypothetical protein [Caudoviricetes sp.]
MYRDRAGNKARKLKIHLYSCVDRFLYFYISA